MPTRPRLRHDNVRTDFTPASDLWETTHKLYSRLDREFDFNLDAAANADNAKCDRWYGPGSRAANDGLRAVWETRTFFNPPFTLLERFTLKALRESRRSSDRIIVGVLPVKTETYASWRTWPYATQIRFLRRRQQYERHGKPIGPARFPTAIVIWSLRSLASRGDLDRAIEYNYTPAPSDHVVWWDWQADEYRYR
jgi:site-specific DNA-methyltransferase (adenine-specific)